MSFCTESDHLVCINPVWFKTMTLIAVFYNLAFYIVAIYAIAKAKEWIRVPTLIWAVILSIFLVTMISEQKWGEYRSKAFDKVVLPYAFFALIPWIIAARMWPEHPFTAASITKTE